MPHSIPSFAVVLFYCVFSLPAMAQSGKSAALEWDRIVAAARKEGKVSISIPASAEMRKQLEDNFKKNFGIEVEVFNARGSTGVRRMAEEFKDQVPAIPTGRSEHESA